MLVIDFAHLLAVHSNASELNMILLMTWGASSNPRGLSCNPHTIRHGEKGHHDKVAYSKPYAGLGTGTALALCPSFCVCADIGHC